MCVLLDYLFTEYPRVQGHDRDAETERIRERVRRYVTWRVCRLLCMRRWSIGISDVLHSQSQNDILLVWSNSVYVNSLFYCCWSISLFVSKLIRMKYSPELFGRYLKYIYWKKFLILANTRRLTEADSSNDVILCRWRPPPASCPLPAERVWRHWLAPCSVCYSSWVRK